MFCQWSHSLGLTTYNKKIYNLYYIEIKDKMHKNKNYNPELMNTMQKL